VDGVIGGSLYRHVLEVRAEERDLVERPAEATA